MTNGVTQRPLSYVDRLESRDPDDVRRIVIHATELPDLATAREYGERIHYPESRTGNSGHFYIDLDGGIEQWVPLDRVAHHVRGHNADSIGIELVNRGRWPDWYSYSSQTWDQDYPDIQINALIRLLRALTADLPEPPTIIGHGQLDRTEVQASDDPIRSVRRKLDPGPTFPWSRVLRESALVRESVDE